MDTMDRPPSRKYAKAPESVAAQRFPALIVSSHAGGHWFESSSLHQKVPDFVRNQELFLFMISKVTRHFGVFRLTQTVTQKPRGQESTGEGRMASSVPLRLFFVGYMVWLMTLPMVSAASRFIPSVAWV